MNSETTSLTEPEQHRRKEAEHKAMQKEMEELRQQAFMAEVAYERKQEAKRRKKNEEDAKRRREECRIRTALLEAAFDDDLEELKTLLKEASEYSEEAVRLSPRLPACGSAMGCTHPLLLSLSLSFCKFSNGNGVWTTLGCSHPFILWMPPPCSIHVRVPWWPPTLSTRKQLGRHTWSSHDTGIH